VVDGARLGRASVGHAAEHSAQAAAAAIEELRKQVLGSHAAASTGAALQAGLAILVVDGALLGVRENFVCGRDLLELFLGVGVVRVLVCKPSES
jgi:hypothetical protein